MTIANLPYQLARASALGRTFEVVDDTSLIEASLTTCYRAPNAGDSENASSQSWFFPGTTLPTTYLFAPRIGAVYKLTGVRLCYTTADADGTIMLKKCTSAQDPASGTDMLSAAVALSATANTNVNGSLHATNSLVINPTAGDRIAMVPTSVDTIANLLVDLTFQRIISTTVLVFMLYTARRKCKLLDIRMSADSWNANGTIDFKKTIHLQNPLNGDSVLAAPLNLASLASSFDTVVPTMTGNTDFLSFNAGDRLSFQLSGDNVGVETCQSINARATFRPMV